MIVTILSILFSSHGIKVSHYKLLYQWLRMTWGCLINLKLK